MSKLASLTLMSANLKGSMGFGKKEDYTCNVPPNTVHVSLSAEDHSRNTLNIGRGNGKVTLEWVQGQTQCKVHAWVNGAAGQPNEVSWTLTGWLLI